MTTRSINVNEYVQVELTTEGLARYIRHFQNLGLKKVPLDNLLGSTLKVQLWELMNIFGDEMYNGNPRVMFRENKVTIL
jgi:hypothetical protein